MRLQHFLKFFRAVSVTHGARVKSSVSSNLGVALTLQRVLVVGSRCRSVQLSQSPAIALLFRQPPAKCLCASSPLGLHLQRTEEVKASARRHQVDSTDQVFILQP